MIAVIQGSVTSHYHIDTDIECLTKLCFIIKSSITHCEEVTASRSRLARLRTTHRVGGLKTLSVVIRSDNMLVVDTEECGASERLTTRQLCQYFRW